MYETILAAIDPHDDEGYVLEHAATLAKRLDATLYVISVVEPSTNPMQFGVREVDDLNRAAERLMSEFERLTVDVDPMGEIRRGDPIDVLLASVTDVDADLIVVGRSRTEGVKAAIFGRTSEELARRTPVPLTIVPVSDA